MSWFTPWYIMYLINMFSFLFCKPTSIPACGHFIVNNLLIVYIHQFLFHQLLPLNHRQCSSCRFLLSYSWFVNSAAPMCGDRLLALQCCKIHHSILQSFCIYSQAAYLCAQTLAWTVAWIALHKSKNHGNCCLLTPSPN